MKNLIHRRDPGPAKIPVRFLRPGLLSDRLQSLARTNWSECQSTLGDVVTIVVLSFVMFMSLPAVCARQAVFADEPTKAAVDAEKAPNEAAKDEKKPKDAVKPAAKAETVEPLNLDLVVAPLRALFGPPEMAAAPAAAAKNAAREVEVANEAMIQQFLQQLRPIMASELGFVRLDCGDLTVEQRKTIKTAALAGLKDAAKITADQQNRQQQGRPVARTKKPTEPRTIIREAIIKSMKETVGEEKMARYMDETNMRIAKRKQTAIIGLVARLDDQLYLTAEQRDKIAESISLKWQDGWEKWTQMARAWGDRYFPQVPDQLVAPHLSQEQKSVWRTLQKNDFNFWGNNENGQDPDADGWWGQDEVSDADAKPAAAGIQRFGNQVLELFR